LIRGALGLSGAAMQGNLRNPLADPGLIGVSGSAALGLVLADSMTGAGGQLPLWRCLRMALAVLYWVCWLGITTGGPRGHGHWR